MRSLLAIMLLGAGFVPVVAAPTKSKTVRPKSATKKAAGAKVVGSGASKTHNKTQAAARSAAGGTRRVVNRRMVHGRWVNTARTVRRPSGPVLQQHPDPARYQEIQQALADRGFYQGEVNGEWDSQSVAALRSFQTHENLTADGKITARSLTGLGLGPRHNGMAAPAPVASAVPVQVVKTQ